jgi:hypothetical protein
VTATLARRHESGVTWAFTGVMVPGASGVVIRPGLRAHGVCSGAMMLTAPHL